MWMNLKNIKLNKEKLLNNTSSDFMYKYFRNIKTKPCTIQETKPMEKQMYDKHKIHNKGVPQGEGHMGPSGFTVLLVILFLIS